MATTYEGTWNLTTQSKNFKKKYGPGGIELYDARNPALSQVKKTFDHTGEEFQDKLDMSLGGGVGGGSLPVASNHQIRRVEFARKKQYYRARIDRESIYASKDGGAFSDGLKELAKKGPMVFSNFIEKQLFLPKAVVSNALVGGGVLGTIATSGVSGSNPYTLTLSDFKAANFEIGNIVNIESGNTDRFEVQGIDVANSTITVYRTSGSQVPAQTDTIFDQGNENNGILGIEGNLSFASGNTLYSEAHGYRYEPGSNTNASSAGITVELMDQVTQDIDQKVGEGIDLIITSHVQWRKLSAQMEDQKRYSMVQPMRAGVTGHAGFKGLEYSGPNGGATIIASRFCDSDKMYFLNRSKMNLKHTRGFGWFDDDGVVFMREADADSYEARFGGYMEFFMIPTYGGRLHSLATS